MERRSEIRNVHLKSMLSERCSEPNALLEAMIKETHRRGQPRPFDTMGARWHHFQTPVHLIKTLGSNCTVVALQRACGIESVTKKELACIDIFLNRTIGEEGQTVRPNQPWAGSSNCHKQGWAQETSHLLPAQFYDKGRESNSLCSWWQEPPLLQEQSSPACANPRSATIWILCFHPACSNTYYVNAPETSEWHCRDI